MSLVEKAICRSVRRFKVTEYVTQLYSFLRYGVVEAAICRSGRRVKVTEYVATGWRRLIGSPKLQIIFHKRAIEYRSLLRKMTCKDKGSYESSPPFTRNV